MIALVAIAIFPLLAAGQQSQNLRDRDPDLVGAKKIHGDLQQANFHSGPFYLWSRLRLSDAGFTDAGYVPTGDDGGSIAISVEAPQRLFFVPHRKVILTADLIPGYSFFSKGDSSGQFNYLVRGDTHLLFNHLYVDIYGQRADQLRAHVADINRLATTREDEFGVATEFKYSSRTSALFNLRYRDTAYPTDRFQPKLEELPQNTNYNPLQLLNRNERNARGSILHKTFPLTSLFVAAEVSNYGFHAATYKDSRRTWYGGGLLYDSGRTQMRVEAGALSLAFGDPAQRDFKGISGSANVARANRRWTYAGGLERDLGFSIFAGNNYYVSDRAHIGAEYAATRRLALRAGVMAERDTYEVDVQGHHRVDDILFPSVGFSYQIRRVSAGVDLGWYDRESTFGGDTASGIRYVLRLSFVP
jgi:hypothetical protein